MRHLADFYKGEPCGLSKHEITTAASAADSARQVLNTAITNGDQAEIKTSNAAIADPVPQYFVAHSTPAGATFLQTESVQPLRLI